MKINCVLVDDEPPALEILKTYISSINGFEIKAVCKNAIEAMEVLHEKKIDLIFLDIKMPMLMGTDLLKSLAHPPKVIFVTAYRDYALEGYELDAVDYLLKPVSFDRFLKAISKYKRMMGYEVTDSPKEYKKNPEAFVYVRVNKLMQKIFVNEILYIESWKDYVKIYLSNGANILARQSISSMENMLSDFSFLRVHRSYMISLNMLTGYNNNEIKIGDKNIPIGRLYKQRVMEVIGGS